VFASLFCFGLIKAVFFFLNFRSFLVSLEVVNLVAISVFLLFRSQSHGFEVLKCSNMATIALFSISESIGRKLFLFCLLRLQLHTGIVVLADFFLSLAKVVSIALVLGV